MTPTNDIHHPHRSGAGPVHAILGIALAAVLLAACTTSGSGAPPSAQSSAPAATPVTTASPTASAEPTPDPTAEPTAESTADPTASPSPSAGTVDPRGDGLDVTFGEFAITLEASAVRPGPVTFVVHNAGQLTHGFEMRIERSGSGSGGDRDKIETRTFRSGETLRVEADLEPGVYEIECFVSDHDDRGMRALLEVRDDAPLVAADPGGADVGTTRIVQFAFVAADIDVPVGTRMTWVNDDPAPHTVTADDGAFDSGQLDSGATWSVVLDTPGTFAYHCDIHPTMVGTVRVH